LILFKNAFIDRYGEGHIVPFLEVLDPTVGIGYPFDGAMKKNASLLENIILPEVQNNNDASNYSYLEMLISEKYMKNNIEIILTDEDYKGREKQIMKLPITFNVFAEIMNDKGSEIVFLKGVSERTAIEGMLRHERYDNDIKSLISEISDFENVNIKNTDYIFVDIIYTTDSKIDNILIHSPIRDNEIIFKIATNNTENKKIYISDIYLVVENNRLNLWSKSLNKNIIPINSTVHNSDISDNHYYKFLSDYIKLFYEHPDIPISPIFKYNDFVPRVRYKNFIFYPASWSISHEEFMWIKSIKEENDERTFISEITKWRNNRNIPDRLLYYYYDQSLLIDFRFKTCIELLLSVIKKSKKIWLFEFLYDSFESIVVDDKNDCYTNEFIFSVLNNNNTPFYTF
jgi:hypothetical protein